MSVFEIHVAIIQVPCILLSVFETYSHASNIDTYFLELWSMPVRVPMIPRVIPTIGFLPLNERTYHIQTD